LAAPRNSKVHTKGRKKKGEKKKGRGFQKSADMTKIKTRGEGGNNSDTRKKSNRQGYRKPGGKMEKKNKLKKKLGEGRGKGPNRKMGVPKVLFRKKGAGRKNQPKKRGKFGRTEKKQE